MDGPIPDLATVGATGVNVGPERGDHDGRRGGNREWHAGIGRNGRAKGDVAIGVDVVAAVAIPVEGERERTAGWAGADPRLRCGVVVAASHGRVARTETIIEERSSDVGAGSRLGIGSHQAHAVLGKDRAVGIRLGQRLRNDETREHPSGEDGSRSQTEQRGNDKPKKGKVHGEVGGASGGAPRWSRDHGPGAAADGALHAALPHSRKWRVASVTRTVANVASAGLSETAAELRREAMAAGDRRAGAPHV